MREDGSLLREKMRRGEGVSSGDESGREETFGRRWWAAMMGRFLNPPPNLEEG
jgi:hypothetical protein